VDALDAEIARWDILLSPSRTATGMLRSAFGYRGAMWETGYPRNDALLAADRDDRRATLRCELGIGEDTTAILYAPTYRDDQVDESELPLGLDPSALVTELGTNHVLWLRPHYYLSHQRRGPGTDQVRDVSGYPDPADLYLAADVLVTDYSSAMFDFAVTGKPIIIFAYDLDHYRDRLRGFTFDLEDEGPGPVVRNQNQLVATLRDLPAVAADTPEQYAAFRDRYCHLEDGRAAERVATALRHPQLKQPNANGLLVPTS